MVMARRGMKVKLGEILSQHSKSKERDKHPDQPDKMHGLRVPGLCAQPRSFGHLRPQEPMYVKKMNK